MVCMLINIRVPVDWTVPVSFLEATTFSTPQVINK
jgi:hypothetical protein